ncbi:MAG: glycosyltransferase family 2 protein [Spirochaetales bacterium]
MRDSPPLVSVIVPAYNHDQYILETLESIKNQTYPKIELIIINDGSTDKTGLLIEDFRAANPEMVIFYYSKSNEGVSKTLNFGLRIAKGEYVACIASDDKWHKNKISKQVEFLENNRNIGMVFCDMHFIIERTISNMLWSTYKKWVKRYFLNGIQNICLYEKLLVDRFIPAPTVMARRECYEKVGFFDEALQIEDMDMWLRISREYPIGYIDESLAYYRLHDSCLSNNTGYIMKGYIATIKKHFSEFPLAASNKKKILIACKIAIKLAKDRISKKKIQ